MRKIMLSALAIAAMVACSKDEVVRTPDLSPILFKGAFVENATRADKATDPSTTTNSTNAINGFDVWGFMDDASGEVFTDENVTGSYAAGWSYVNTQYWTKGHEYWFYALAPMDSKNVTETLATGDAAKLGLGEVGFTNVDGTEDLLYAEATASTEEKANLDPVALSFDHLLSKVKFTFTNGFANNNISIEISNLQMTAPKAGSIDLATTTPAWVLTDGQENATILKFNSGTETTTLTGTVKTQECENERLTIPAGVEQVYEISFDVKMYNGDVLALEGNKTAAVKGVALEIGKAYNFTTTLNASNITDDADEELYPIEFTVTEVKDWENADAVVVGIGGDVDDLTMTTDADAASVVNLTGTLDGAGHTLSAVEGVNYVVSNTARLINASGGSIIKDLTIDGKDVVYNGYGIRGIYTVGTGDVEVDDVHIYNCTYAINANNAGKITVKNSTLQGWNSYGSTTLSTFDMVEFIDGKYHNFRPYNNAELTNCSFEKGVVIDFSMMIDGATIKFKNCKYDGEVITAENFATVVSTDGDYTDKVSFE